MLIASHQAFRLRGKNVPKWISFTFREILMSYLNIQKLTPLIQLESDEIPRLMYQRKYSHMFSHNISFQMAELHSFWFIQDANIKFFEIIPNYWQFVELWFLRRLRSIGTYNIFDFLKEYKPCVSVRPWQFLLIQQLLNATLRLTVTTHILISFLHYSL